MALLMVLHAWQNMTAELTLFADREFYTVSDLISVNVSSPAFSTGLVEQ